MPLSEAEAAAVARVVEAAAAQGHPYARHRFNVHRWITAYDRDEAQAAKVLKRHLNLRAAMQWDSYPELTDGFDERIDAFAPLAILGQNKEDDNKVVLFERSGRIDIHGLIENVRATPFMRAKFRVMERIQRKVVELEHKTGRQSGGLLVMDLHGLQFSPALLSILAGPYRIMWGTLFEQYPQLIRHIVIVRAPAFVNVLYSTCVPFIPADYRSRLEICSSSDPSKTLLKYISAERLPAEYLTETEGGFEVVSLPSQPVPFPALQQEDIELDGLSIPAGSTVIRKYFWEQDSRLHFQMRHSQEFQFFIFHSTRDSAAEEGWREIFAGSERPALRMTDEWEWRVPQTGFYYLRFGNEKAWFYSVSVEYRIWLLNGENRELQHFIS